MYFLYYYEKRIFILFKIQNTVFFFCFCNEAYFSLERVKSVYFYVAFYMWEAKSTQVTI